MVEHRSLKSRPPPLVVGLNTGAILMKDSNETGDVGSGKCVALCVSDAALSALQCSVSLQSVLVLNVHALWMWRRGMTLAIVECGVSTVVRGCNFVPK